MYEATLLGAKSSVAIPWEHRPAISSAGNVMSSAQQATVAIGDAETACLASLQALFGV